MSYPFAKGGLCLGRIQREAIWYYLICPDFYKLLFWFAHMWATSLCLRWHLGCDSPVVPFSVSSIWRLHNFLDRDWECRGCDSPRSSPAEPEPGSSASWMGQMLFLSPLALSEILSLRALLDLWLHLKCRIAFGGCGHFPAWLRGTDTRSVWREWESPHSSGCAEYLSLEVLFIKTSLRWTLR